MELSDALFSKLVLSSNSFTPPEFIILSEEPVIIKFAFCENDIVQITTNTTVNIIFFMILIYKIEFKIINYKLDAESQFVPSLMKEIAFILLFET